MDGMTIAHHNYGMRRIILKELQKIQISPKEIDCNVGIRLASIDKGKNREHGSKVLVKYCCSLLVFVGNHQKLSKGI